MSDAAVTLAAVLGTLLGIRLILVVHEHCHAFVARRLTGLATEVRYVGFEVRGATLVATGGVCRLAPMHRYLQTPNGHITLIAFAPVAILVATIWLPAVLLVAMEAETYAQVFGVVLVWVVFLGPSGPDWRLGLLPGGTKLWLADLEEAWQTHVAAEGVPVEWDPDARRERHARLLWLHETMDDVRERAVEVVRGVSARAARLRRSLGGGRA